MPGPVDRLGSYLRSWFVEVLKTRVRLKSAQAMGGSARPDTYRSRNSCLTSTIFHCMANQKLSWISHLAG